MILHLPKSLRGSRPSIIRATRNSWLMLKHTSTRRIGCNPRDRDPAAMLKFSAPLEHTALVLAKAGTLPYPPQWERHLVVDDGWKVFARPIRPDDEPLILHLLRHVCKEDLQLRFFDSIKEFSHPFLVRLTRL